MAADVARSSDGIRTRERWLIAAALVGVVAFGAWRHHVALGADVAGMRRGMRGTAAAIAGVIDRWLVERRQDVALVALAHDTTVVRQLLVTHGYTGAWIVHRPTGAVRFSAGGEPPPPSVRRQLERVPVDTGAVALGRIDPRSGKVEVLFVARLDDAGSTVLASRADLTPLLAPYMASLSRLSVTGRSILAIPDGDTVAVLAARNDGGRTVLRLHRADVPRAVALALTPADTTIFAADHDGLPVLASVLHLEALGWGVVRQVERAEIVNRVTRRTLTEVGFVAALLLGFGWVVIAHRRLVRIEGLRSDLMQAQLSVLRAQLQPHFLFNVLNGAIDHVHRDPHAAETMLHRLARMLRLNLATRHDVLVTLDQELEVIRAYEGIERIRCGDRVRFTYEVEEGLEAALVPPFLLQPLVENSIAHGFPEDRTGRVVIRAAAHEDRLRLEVEDSGIGIAPSAAGTARGFGIGFESIRGRLDRLFGAEHAVTVHSTPGAGTRVTIDLPLRLGASRQNSAAMSI